MAGNILQDHSSSSQWTITLTGLATSSTKVAGRESTAYAISGADDLNGGVGGKITTGTSPTAGKTIDIYMYGAYNDTPTYPVNITGSDAAATMDSENSRNSALRLLHTIQIDSTSSRTYSFGPFGWYSLFNFQPTHVGLWVTHDTAVNLHATASNHALYRTGEFARYT